MTVQDGDGKGLQIWRFALRCLWEFAPPIIVAGLWSWFGPNKLTGGVWGFYATWIALSWIWLNALRIWHQQHQKKDLSDLGTTLTALKDTIGNLANEVRSVAERFPDNAEVAHLEQLVNTANNQIETANTAFESTKSYVLNAETGRYKIVP